MPLKKGSAAAKAFMAKLRKMRKKSAPKKAVAKKAVKKKSAPKKAVAKKIGSVNYYGDGKIISAGRLISGEKYEWIAGAGYLEVQYIGPDTGKIKAGAKFGGGGYIFKWVKGGGYINLSAKAVLENIRTIPKSIGAPKKSSSSHKDTKSHNVNIRVVSGLSNKTKFIM